MLVLCHHWHMLFHLFLLRENKFSWISRVGSPDNLRQNFSLFQSLISSLWWFWFVLSEKGSSFLDYQRGDLIILEQETNDNAEYWYGENDRTGRKGDFPSEAVYILPTTTKPSSDVVVSLPSQSSKEKTWNFFLKMTLVAIVMIQPS